MNRSWGSRRTTQPHAATGKAHRSPSLQRLHRGLQKNPSGDFAEDSFRVSGNSKESSATRAATLCSRSPDRMEPRRGPGESRLLRFPRALFGTFSRERKYTLQQRQAPKEKTTSPEAPYARIFSPSAAKINRKTPFTNTENSDTITCGLVNLPRRRAITPTAHFAGWRLPIINAMQDIARKWRNSHESGRNDQVRDHRRFCPARG